MCTATATTTTPTMEDFHFLMSAFTATTTIPQQQRRKRVRFAPYVYAAESGPLAKEELPELWYAQSDLQTFKSQAKQLARSSSSKTQTKQTQEVDCSLRGLEHCSPDRQKFRYMSIKATLSAYKRGMNNDQISLVSRKCSNWSNEIAFIQACHDFAIVYQPSMITMIPTLQEIKPPQFPFMMTISSSSSSSLSSRKRSASPETSSSSPTPEGDEGGRRVRQRTTVC